MGHTSGRLRSTALAPSIHSAPYSGSVVLDFLWTPPFSYDSITWPCDLRLQVISVSLMKSGSHFGLCNICREIIAEGDLFFYKSLWVFETR